MNKSEVCVKLTLKNCKKVLEILEMFGEKVYHNTRLSLEDGNHLNEGYPFVYWNGHYWAGSEDDKDLTLTKPRKLRNILAKEHLKEGDVAILDCGSEIRYVAKIESVDNDVTSPFNSFLWIALSTEGGSIQPYEGSFDNFLRFATDAEKALLEPVKPVSYTHEVWINHYNDREFYIHKTRAGADEFSQGPGKITVKATLTYDIPMTKV